MTSSNRIGIIGGGFVGKATSLLSKDHVIYDLNPDLCVPPGATLADVAQCPFIFICVPTPMKNDGSCFLGIVESVIRELRQITETKPILRSTVPVGTSSTYGCYFMPEFLTERNWRHDIYHASHWILGVDEKEDPFSETFQKFLSRARQDGCILNDTLYVHSTKEAELIKYFRNCFLATKVAFCNEMYTFCHALSINYETIRSTTVMDKRIGEFHTGVPGPDGKCGYGGTCFPKDMGSLITQFHLQNTACPVLEAAQFRNTRIDRVEQDWKTDVGRAVIHE